MPGYLLDSPRPGAIYYKQPRSKLKKIFTRDRGIIEKVYPAAPPPPPIMGMMPQPPWEQDKGPIRRFLEDHIEWGKRSGSYGRLPGPPPPGMMLPPVNPGPDILAMTGTDPWNAAPWAFPSPAGRPLPQLELSEVPENRPPFPIAPFAAGPPDQYRHLPKAQRKYIQRVREEQLKVLEMAQRAEMQRAINEHKTMERIAKHERKQAKRELKAREKQIKWLRKHGDPRPMPFPTPPMQEAPPAENKPPDPPTRFMIMPTMEQFGVRRPLDAPGKPAGLGGPTGQQPWPMMSRTMTQAMKDMSVEERIFMEQAGKMFSPR